MPLVSLDADGFFCEISDDVLLKSYDFFINVDKIIGLL